MPSTVLRQQQEGFMMTRRGFVPLPLTMWRQRWTTRAIGIGLIAVLVALSGALPQATALALQDDPRAELRRQTDDAEHPRQARGIPA